MERARGARHPAVVVRPGPLGLSDHAADAAIGITTTTPQLPSVMRIAETVRRLRPDLKLILGGPHVTLVYSAKTLEARRGIPRSRASLGGAARSRVQSRSAGAALRAFDGAGAAGFHPPDRNEAGICHAAGRGAHQAAGDRALTFRAKTSRHFRRSDAKKDRFKGSPTAKAGKMPSDRKIAVIGLGYVGLPVAVAFAQAGSAVIGFDIDPGASRSCTRARIAPGR